VKLSRRLYPKTALAKGFFAFFAFIFFFLATIAILERQTDEERLLGRIEETTSLTPEEKTVVSQKLQELSVDSDNDGLKDWEEIIYRTDPKNSDTDGDGTNDGDEIQKNRDPLVQGPDDSLAPPKSAASSKQKNADMLANNLTYTFLRKLQNAIGPSVGGENIEVDTETAGAVVQEMGLLDSQATLASLTAPITIHDFTISKENNSSAMKNYFNTVFTEVYEKNFFTINDESRDVIAVLTKALETKNFAGLAKLDAFIDAHTTGALSLKKIPVPEGYEDFAIELLTYIERNKAILRIFRNTENDPLYTLQVVGLYFPNEIRMLEFQEQIGARLKEAGIAFSPNEKGYAFFQ